MNVSGYNHATGSMRGMSAAKGVPLSTPVAAHDGTAAATIIVNNLINALNGIKADAATNNVAAKTAKRPSHTEAFNELVSSRKDFEAHKRLPLGEEVIKDTEKLGATVKTVRAWWGGVGAVGTNLLNARTRLEALDKKFQKEPDGSAESKEDLTVPLRELKFFYNKIDKLMRVMGTEAPGNAKTILTEVKENLINLNDKEPNDETRLALASRAARSLAALLEPLKQEPVKKCCDEIEFHMQAAETGHAAMAESVGKMNPPPPAVSGNAFSIGITHLTPAVANQAAATDKVGAGASPPPPVSTRHSHGAVSLNGRDGMGDAEKRTNAKKALAASTAWLRGNNGQNQQTSNTGHGTGSIKLRKHNKHSGVKSPQNVRSTPKTPPRLTKDKMVEGKESLATAVKEVGTYWTDAKKASNAERDELLAKFQAAATGNPADIPDLLHELDRLVGNANALIYSLDKTLQKDPMALMKGVMATIESAKDVEDPAECCKKAAEAVTQLGQAMRAGFAPIDDQMRVATEGLQIVSRISKYEVVKPDDIQDFKKVYGETLGNLRDVMKRGSNTHKAPALAQAPTPKQATTPAANPQLAPVVPLAAKVSNPKGQVSAAILHSEAEFVMRCLDTVLHLRELPDPQSAETTATTPPAEPTDPQNKGFNMDGFIQLCYSQNLLGAAVSYETLAFVDNSADRSTHEVMNAVINEMNEADASFDFKKFLEMVFRKVDEVNVREVQGGQVTIAESLRKISEKDSFGDNKNSAVNAVLGARAQDLDSATATGG